MLTIHHTARIVSLPVRRDPPPRLLVRFDWTECEYRLVADAGHLGVIIEDSNGRTARVKRSRITAARSKARSAA